MIRIAGLGLLVLAPQALPPHPRIWLDAPTLTALRARVAANAATRRR